MARTSTPAPHAARSAADAATDPAPAPVAPAAGAEKSQHQSLKVRIHRDASRETVG